MVTPRGAQHLWVITSSEVWSRFRDWLLRTERKTSMSITVLFTTDREKEANAHQWINGYTSVVYTSNRILLSVKKERNSDTCHNMHDHWRHYAEWNMPITKGQIFCDSHLWIVSSMVVARGMGSYYWIGTEFRFGKMKTILEMDGGNDCTKMWLYFNANELLT